MGAFANGRIVIVLACTIAAVITAMNAFLIYQQLLG
jgi:hypothetical protein